MDAQDLRAVLVSHGVSAETADLVVGVPRDRFVPRWQRSHAWRDSALSLSHGQAISQPTVVAVMTQALEVGPSDRVLDVGTGSGYQAAVLAAAGAEVVSVERIPALAQSARDRLAELGLAVEVRCADGSMGAPDRAPFDGIVVAAATPTVPPALVEQLREPGDGHRGGRLVLPLGRSGDGSGSQELVVLERVAEGVRRRHLMDVLFVPLVTG